MCLDKLIELLPCPSEPNYVGNPHAWEAAERMLGTQFPSSYKKWLAAYGVGRISDWLRIADPFPSENMNENIFDRTAFTRQADTIDVGRETGDTISTSEILTIGCDEDGNLLHWHMVGEPDQWPLIYTSVDGLFCDKFTFSFTEFIYRWVSGAVVPAVLSDYDLFSDRGRFFTKLNIR